MNRIFRFSVIALFALGLGTSDPIQAADAPSYEFFEQKIRPVLVEHCYQCHSAEAAKAGKLKGGLHLDTREGIRRGGERGAAVVPKDVAKSLLIAALRQESVKMPPKGKLPDAVIADFVRWVEQGADDPRNGLVHPPSTTIDIEKAKSFWAFRSPRLSPLPKVSSTDWPAKDLDWFILAEQEKRGLQAVRPATKPEWIRRATLDLIGLPPTPEEIDAFEKDVSPEAHAKVVDRLLASPHYGERWGRCWLDLARYTDDLGGTLTPVQAPNAFRYRDWVVQAFNRDMPYDAFVRLQLAGDLLPEPAEDYVERLAGLGFQGLGQKFSGNAVGMVKLKMADELDDRVDTVSRSLLALTVSCARCHDHKFDPIPTIDYYSLTSAYNGATWGADRPLASPQAIAAFKEWEKTVADSKARLNQLLLTEGQRLGREELLRIDDYLLTAWKLRVLAQRKMAANEAEFAKRERLQPLLLSRWVNALMAGKPLPLMNEWQAVADEAAKSAVVKSSEIEIPAKLAEETATLKSRIVEALNQKGRIDPKSPAKKEKPISNPKDQDTLLKVFLFNDGAPFKIVGPELVALLNEPLRKQHDQLQVELNRLASNAPPALPNGMTVQGGGVAMQVNIRGNPEQLGESATPGFLRILRTSPAAKSDGFTRLDLANAIASRDNPLTARVWVNRVWHYHFGRGIVGTLSNFGSLGDRPTHPELLDHLAVKFMESGWSTKWLHREIVLSATYRLSSALDAKNANQDGDNHYLWRFAPRRLDFEAWRDGMLAVSGKLDPQIGGPPRGKGELHPEDPVNERRTLYCFISRFKPNTTLTLFDFPEPNVTSERRNVTTIPQQQLFALNSPFVIATAKAFAKRLEQQEPDDSARLRLAWRMAFGRLPSEREVDLSKAFLRQPPNPAVALTPWEMLCQSLLTANEFGFMN